MIKLFLKYFVYNGNTKSLKVSFVLPLLTIMVGSYIMFISYAIMDGFKDEILKSIYFFNKENNIIINKKISDQSSNRYEELIIFLKEKDYIDTMYEERIIFIKSNFQSTISKAYGIINFSDFKPKEFFEYNYKNNLNYFCYVGSNLARNLNIKPGDQIDLISVLDFKNLYDFPETKITVKDIIKSDILKYDNSIYMPYDSILFKKNVLFNINLNKELSLSDYNFIKERFSNSIEINSDNYIFSELIHAINFEKTFYVFFGFVIVIISSIMLVGFNISSIVTNISKIGILESLGLKRKKIKILFLLNTLVLTILGIMISLILIFLTIYFDNNYMLLDFIFDPKVYFNFKLKLPSQIIFNIIILIFMIMFASTIYPLNKIGKLNIIKAIKGRNI
tara:strand:+ start:6549 stop:7724 length:1176 start_codon:yes stop_codon:yes gene_type:complete